MGLHVILFILSSSFRLPASAAHPPARRWMLARPTRCGAGPAPSPATTHGATPPTCPHADRHCHASSPARVLRRPPLPPHTCRAARLRLSLPRSLHCCPRSRAGHTPPPGVVWPRSAHAAHGAAPPACLPAARGVAPIARHHPHYAPSARVLTRTAAPMRRPAAPRPHAGRCYLRSHARRRH